MKTGRPEAVSKTVSSSSWALRTDRVEIRLGPALRLEGAIETGCGSPNPGRASGHEFDAQYALLDGGQDWRRFRGNSAGSSIRRRFDLGSGDPADRRGDDDHHHRTGQNRDSFPCHALT